MSVSSSDVTSDSEDTSIGPTPPPAPPSPLWLLPLPGDKCKHKLTVNWAGGMKRSSCTQTTLGIGGAPTSGSFQGLPTGLGGRGGGRAAMAAACCFLCSSSPVSKIPGSRRFRSCLGCPSVSEHFRFVQATSYSVLCPFRAWGSLLGSKPGPDSSLNILGDLSLSYLHIFHSAETPIIICLCTYTWTKKRNGMCNKIVFHSFLVNLA